MNTKKSSNFFFILIICSGYLLLPGCSPGSIVLKDDASLKDLNEMVKERRVRVTTLDSVYEGENILITRDSTTLKYLTTKPKVVTFSNIKEFHFDSGSNTEGTIELKDNQIFKVRNINISNFDSIVRFDAMIPGPFIFPTKDITKIQRWGHLNSVLNGMRIGFLGGAVAGTLLGFVIGLSSTEVTNSGRHPSGDQEIYVILGSCVGGFTGVLFGAAIGASLG